MDISPSHHPRTASRTALKFHLRTVLATSGHADLRLAQRNIPLEGVIEAVRHGRRWRSKGAWRYRLDRRSVQRAAEFGIDLSDYEGIHAVMGNDGTLITAWINRSGKRIWR